MGEIIRLMKRNGRGITIEMYQKVCLPIQEILNSNYELRIRLRNGREYTGKVIRITQEEYILMPGEALVPIVIEFQTQNELLKIEVLDIVSVDEPYD